MSPILTQLRRIKTTQANGQSPEDFPANIVQSIVQSDTSQVLRLVYRLVLVLARHFLTARGCTITEQHMRANERRKQHN